MLTKINGNGKRNTVFRHGITHEEEKVEKLNKLKVFPLTPVGIFVNLQSEMSGCVAKVKDINAAFSYAVVGMGISGGGIVM